MNGVTIAQVIVVSEQRHAALPAELAGSLVLAVADALTTLSLKLGPAELVLLDDGTVRVCGGTPTDEASAEQSLRLLLDRILLSSCSVTPALLRAARRPGQGKVSILVRELEVALIPTNRGAARRALARLYREVSQAIRQYPRLQQAVESFQFPEPVEVDVVESRSIDAAFVEPAAPVEYSVALSVSPVPVALKEPEAIDEWIEISPEFPDVIAVTLQSDRIPQAINGCVSIDIPDLEIPIGGIQQKPHQESAWQPVEHTQKLVPIHHSKTPIADHKVAQVTALDIAPPPTSTPPTALAAEPEVVELSDDDLHEVTAGLAIASAKVADTGLPQTITTPHAWVAGEVAAELPAAALVETSTIFADLSALGAAEIMAPPATIAPPPALAAESEALEQTAEPFLLVVPTLLQNTDHDTTVAEIVCSESASPKDAATLEPCAGESEDTVLDAVTFVEEEKPAAVAPIDEISWSEFDSESDSDPLAIVNFTPYGPVIARIVEPLMEERPQVLGPHSYAAPARFPPTPTKVSERIAQFSVARNPSPNELTHGLRTLAGVEEESNSDPSATPPPTAYAAEQVVGDHPAPKGVFVRTLIGLGTTGLLIVFAQISAGKFAKDSAVATNVSIEVGRSSCRAILKLDEIPLGTTVHVSQNGQRPRSEMLQVSQVPFRIGGLSCGEPAELLVKLSERGWYRVPIEAKQLSGIENSEPVRIATYLKSR